MAKLGRYASVQPDQFGRMTPGETRQLDGAVSALVNDDWSGLLQIALEHARLIATLTRRR